MAGQREPTAVDRGTPLAKYAEKAATYIRKINNLNPMSLRTGKLELKHTLVGNHSSNR